MQNQDTQNTTETTRPDPARASQEFSLTALQADNLERFVTRLESQRFMHILPAGETLESKSTGILDTKTYFFYPDISEFTAFLERHPFIHFYNYENNFVTFHVETKVLWSNDASDNLCTLDNAKKLVQEGQWMGLSDWKLPGKNELQNFVTAHKNPYRTAEDSYRLQIKDSPYSICRWMTDQGLTDTDTGAGTGQWHIQDHGEGHIFSCHHLFKNLSYVEILVDLSNRGWTLCSPDVQILSIAKPKTDWAELAPTARLQAIQKQGIRFLSADRQADEQAEILDPAAYYMRDQLRKLDYKPCRLPLLDEARLCDPEQGLWELWGEDTVLCKDLGVIARDPGRDVQRRAVAIDFGTSSTVVACETRSGGRELLRIGVRDFYQAVKPVHFENPTVLECLNYESFQQVWTTQVYRPALDWDWIRAAHEAQASFRDNPGDTRILASILPRLKQWALRDSEHRRVRITDRNNHEIELPLHSERNPLRGQALRVASSDPFDPVELYAWYLGMAINWRGHGLFLKYYLSFPVEYPREVRDRILASFRRGLQRSLPHSLVTTHPETLNDFSVAALASEPTAYAAAALSHLQVSPTEEGVPYAVYDFGGGTTDFDFGFLRWASNEEEENGYEQVFEHLANSGDKYLGGENLIEHMAYQTFQNNLDELRRHRIQFTRPMDAPAFSGSEAFLTQTQAAQTNTVMLSARLRPFLESDQPELAAQIKLELINADGQKQACELMFDAESLDALLLARMRAGVDAFLAELARLRNQFPVVPIHILLAGNGSRSRHIRSLFDTSGELWPSLLHHHFGENPPEIITHQPLPMDKDNIHAPTAKTGVALGLLQLIPGENTLLMDHLHMRHDGQAPFSWFAGRVRRRKFEPVMSPSGNYGHWYELGRLQEGVFNLYTTRSPRAHEGMEDGDAELTKHRLDFPAAPSGARLYACARGPHEIELAVTSTTPTEDNEAIRQKLLLH